MDTIKSVMYGIFVLAFLAVSILGINQLIEERNNFEEKSEIISEIRSGTIIDKQITTTEGLFRPTTIIYCITVSAEVEYKGEPYVAEKDFTVPEEIYNQYSVGDWFDCQNLNVTGKEEETETANA